METFVFFGIFTALAWGIMVFLLNLATTRENKNNDPAKVCFTLAGGIFLTFLIGFLMTNGFAALEQFSFKNLWLAVGSGALWGLGTIGVTTAMYDPQTSISKIVPLYNTNTLIVVLAGILFLNETINNPVLLILGAVCVVAGSVIITGQGKDKSEKPAVTEGRTGFKIQKWIIYGLTASFCWSAFALISKILVADKSAGNDPFLISLEQSLGIVLAALIFLMARRKRWAALSKSGFGFSLASGVLWGLGSLAILLAINHYAAPISGLVPIYNTNTLVAVILGIIVLREVPAQRRNVILGALLIVAGGVLVSIN